MSGDAEGSGQYGKIAWLCYVDIENKNGHNFEHSITEMFNHLQLYSDVKDTII